MKLKTETSKWQPGINVDNLTSTQQWIWKLIRGEQIKCGDLKGQGLIKAIMLKQNLELLSQVRELWQIIFDDLGQTLIDNNGLDNFYFETIIGDLLCHLPLFQPVGEIRIPCLFNDHWSMFTYDIERLELTPNWIGSPITAYGLVCSHGNVDPILIFKPTTYPSDDGFGLSLLTDINPFESAGYYVHRIGFKVIQQWLFGRHARVLGKSLGGIQACLRH